MANENKYAISLFSGSGIGDIGFKKAGFTFKIMCESEYDRAELLKLNFPDSKVLVGDINEYAEVIFNHTVAFCNDKNTEIFLVSCTAPCQGMSKSGQGTLLRNIRLGKRPKLDPRNRLILPALEIISRVRPLFVVFENVCEMGNTIIEDVNGNMKLILDIIQEKLGDSYYGEAYNVEFADYGIPQRRKRLISVYTRDSNAVELYKKGILLIPEPTHSKNANNGEKKWVSIMEALKGFTPLDSRSKETAEDPNNPFHRVPVLDSKKYNWIRYTLPGKSAFDNQCINPECGYQGNKTHGASKNKEGINQSYKDTPLYCEKCGKLLPRPYTVNKDGILRIMSGYTSAYKRMEPHLPSSALTRNLSFPCSDNKVHPYENRVLSLAEAFKLHTISDYVYKWGPIKDKEGKIIEVAPNILIRLAIGESIPPKFTELLGKHLIKLHDSKSEFKLPPKQTLLFSHYRERCADSV